MLRDGNHVPILIIAGRVRVNGKIAELGQKADPATDKITVEGKPIAAVETLTYIALNKPRTILSTVEPERCPKPLDATFKLPGL